MRLLFDGAVYARNLNAVTLVYCASQHYLFSLKRVFLIASFSTTHFGVFWLTSRPSSTDAIGDHPRILVLMTPLFSQGWSLSCDPLFPATRRFSSPLRPSILRRSWFLLGVFPRTLDQQSPSGRYLLP